MDRRAGQHPRQPPTGSAASGNRGPGSSVSGPGLRICSTARRAAAWCDPSWTRWSDRPAKSGHEGKARHPGQARLASRRRAIAHCRSRSRAEAGSVSRCDQVRQAARRRRGPIPMSGEGGEGDVLHSVGNTSRRRPGESGAVAGVSNAFGSAHPLHRAWPVNEPDEETRLRFGRTHGHRGFGLFIREVCRVASQGPSGAIRHVLGGGAMPPASMSTLAPSALRMNDPRDRVDPELIGEPRLPFSASSLTKTNPSAQLDDLRVGKRPRLHHAAPAAVPSGEVGKDTPVRPSSLSPGFVEGLEEANRRWALGRLGSSAKRSTRLAGTSSARTARAATHPSEPTGQDQQIQ